MTYYVFFFLSYFQPVFFHSCQFFNRILHIQQQGCFHVLVCTRSLVATCRHYTRVWRQEHFLFQANVCHIIHMVLQISCILDFLGTFWVKRCGLFTGVYSIYSISKIKFTICIAVRSTWWKAFNSSYCNGNRECSALQCRSNRKVQNQFKMFKGLELSALHKLLNLQREISWEFSCFLWK